MRARPAPFSLAPETAEAVPWFRDHLLPWFSVHGRPFPWRESGRTAYQVLIAEILLQRTPARAVAHHYCEFLVRYPSWESLAEAAPEQLHEYLRPLGLWHLKTAILGALARSIVEHGGQVPETREALERFSGVGQYTTSAVLAVVHSQHEPLLDVNMTRVLERFFGMRERIDIRDDPYLHALSRTVVDHPESLAISWAVLDLGALVCRARRPLCPGCPVGLRCKHDTPQPMRSRKKADHGN